MDINYNFIMQVYVEIKNNEGFDTLKFRHYPYKLFINLILFTFVNLIPVFLSYYPLVPFF